MQIMGPSSNDTGMYYGYALSGFGINPEQAVAAVTTAPKYITDRADFKALSAADQALVGRLWNLPFAELVAARLASIKKEAWGGLTAEQVQARIPAFYYAFIRRVNDRTDFIKMGNRNKALALWLLTAYEPTLRDAYFAVKNKTKFTVPEAGRPADNKNDPQYNNPDDTWKNLYWAVDLAMAGRFPKGLPVAAAQATQTAANATVTAGAAAQAAVAAANASGNPAAQQAAAAAAAEKQRADANAAEALKQAALAKAANDKAAQAAADASAAIAAANAQRAAAAKTAAAEIQKAKDAADKAAAAAAAQAAQAAAAAEQRAAEAIALSQSREQALLAQQEAAAAAAKAEAEARAAAEAEEKKKRTRNIMLGVGAVAVVGGLVWYMRRK